MPSSSYHIRGSGKFRGKYTVVKYRRDQSKGTVVAAYQALPPALKMMEFLHTTRPRADKGWKFGVRIPS